MLALIAIYVCRTCRGYRGAARTGSLFLDCRCQKSARQTSKS